MKFEKGDATDRALVTAIAHEFILCKDSFERFTQYAGLNIMGKRDKLTKIRSHDAYASFLHHLYEFYVGCIKRDLHDLKDIDYRRLDRIFNAEAKKAAQQQNSCHRKWLRAFLGKPHICLSS